MIVYLCNFEVFLFLNMHLTLLQRTVGVSWKRCPSEFRTTFLWKAIVY